MLEQQLFPSPFFIRATRLSDEKSSGCVANRHGWSPEHEGGGAKPGRKRREGTDEKKEKKKRETSEAPPQVARSGSGSQKMSYATPWAWSPPGNPQSDRASQLSLLFPGIAVNVLE